MSTLGERLRMLRKAMNKTQAEVGEVLGVSNITISNYERDVLIPSTHNLIILARYFNANLGYIVGDSDRMHTNQARYSTICMVPIVSPELALNLPDLIAPYADKSMEFPIERTNTDTFAVKAFSNNKEHIVVAERGSYKSDYVLYKKDNALMFCHKNNFAESKRDIIAGVLYFEEI